MSKRSIRPVAIAGLAVVIMTFGVFGGWAAIAKLDSAVVAPGTITVQGNRKVVQHLEGGIVSGLMVDEADHVEVGETLIRLSSIESQSNLDILTTRAKISEIAEARLRAELTLSEEIELPDGFDLENAPSDVKEAYANQKGIFEDRRSILNSQIDILASRIEQTREQIEGLQLQKSAMERRLENYKTLVDRMTSGQEQGLVQANILSQRMDEYIQIEADLGNIISQIAQAKNTISESELQSLQVRQEYRERANTELETIKSEVAEVSERLKVATDVLGRTEIRAPASGSVQNLKVHTVGSVIRPGDVLMEIVPEGEEFIITARVAPIDVDNVSPGLRTEVRFTAFKSRLTPVVLGEVETISEDVITPEAQDQMPYYLARINVAPEDISDEIRTGMSAGMPVDVIITTGERRVVDYLTSPLMDAVRKSLIEE